MGGAGAGGGHGCRDTDRGGPGVDVRLRVALGLLALTACQRMSGLAPQAVVAVEVVNRHRFGMWVNGPEGRQLGRVWGWGSVCFAVVPSAAAGADPMWAYLDDGRLVFAPGVDLRRAPGWRWTLTPSDGQTAAQLEPAPPCLAEEVENER